MGVTKTDYIDREKVKQLIKNFGKGAIEDGQKALDPVDDIILLAAAVDLIHTDEVAEVRRGKWNTFIENGVGWWKECSVCGAKWMLNSSTHVCEATPYCYNCGAKMDGGSRDGQ